VRRIIEAGRFAPSAGNCQPWKFVVVQDPKMIADMTSDVVQFCGRITSMLDYIDGAPWKLHLARAFQRLRPNDLHPIPFGAMKLIAEGKLGLFHGAPHRGPHPGGHPRRRHARPGSRYRRSEHGPLAAHSYGVLSGTCWVGFVKPLAYLPKWRKKIGIKSPYKLYTSVAIGYPRGNPDGQVPAKPRPLTGSPNPAASRSSINQGDYHAPASYIEGQTGRRDLRPPAETPSSESSAIDRDACTGCTMCTRACPANTLEMAEKKSRMKADMPMCMSCGDCVAVCPEQAITITRFIEFTNISVTFDGESERPRKF